MSTRKPVKGGSEYLECIDEEGVESSNKSDLAKKTPTAKPKVMADLIDFLLSNILIKFVFVRIYIF